MHRIAAVAIVTIASSARADVSGELGAGAGTQSTDSGYATANASLAIDLTRPAAPLAHRGLGGADETGGLWLWTGADPDDRDGLHADGSVLALGKRVIANGRVGARVWGWQLDGAVAYQPVGDLRQRFWLSGRDATANNIHLQVPAVFTGASGGDSLAMGDLDLGVTWRSARVDPGTDFELTLHFLRWRDPTHQFELLQMHVTGYDLVESYTPTTTMGVTAQDMGVDFAALTWKLDDHLQLSASGGLDALQPLGQYVTTTATTGSSGPPSAVSPRYWFELSERADDRTWSIGGGSWARLDPTGNAADAGQLVSASLDQSLGRIHLNGALQVGHLRRLLVGAMASSDLAPAGTAMWMGRGEAGASLRLGHDLDVTGTAWLERSDRDDPRWLVPSDGRIATRAGGDLTARWRFRTL